MADTELQAFLASIGLDRLLTALADEDIHSVETLRLCDDADLNAMGLKIGARVRIRQALQVRACRSALVAFHFVLVFVLDIGLDFVSKCLQIIRGGPWGNEDDRGIF